jgi:peptidoglycan/LPS O-acetylase OafA/YrhL
MTGNAARPRDTATNPLAALLEGSHLPALDGLRAIAVFTVIAFHSGVVPVPGDLGVSGFFVLSGFLITWLLLKEMQASGTISLRGFYLRRTLRIFPAYYVFITFSFAVDRLHGQHWPPGMIAAAYGYFINYYNAIHNHPSTSVAHAWSLAVEEQFYLLWPALFLLLIGRGQSALRRGTVAIIVIVAAWRSYLFVVQHVGMAWVYNAFDSRFDNLAVGCLLAVLCRSRAFTGATSVLARSPVLPLATIAALGISRTGISERWHYTAGFTVDAILVAILIVQLLWLYRSPLWRWLDHPLTRYLGRISYPLYLYHQWGLSAGARFSGGHPFLALILGVGVSIMLASGSYFLVERPFIRLKRYFEPAR